MGCRVFDPSAGRCSSWRVATVAERSSACARRGACPPPPTSSDPSGGSATAPAVSNEFAPDLCRSGAGPFDNLMKRGRMCPVCIATMAVAVAGTTSAGGCVGLAIGKLRGRIGARVSQYDTLEGGKDDDTPPDRITGRVARDATRASDQGEGAHPVARGGGPPTG